MYCAVVTLLFCTCFQVALGFYTQAIELDPRNEKFYCNRSMCHGAMKQWDKCELDAKMAIERDDKYIKAYFWLVKASVSLLA